MANESAEHPQVQHNRAASRFEVVIDGKESVAEYVVQGGDAIFTHTFVPPEMRGRGLAEKLVRAALDWAKSEKLRIVPQCSYVEVFVRRHPEYASDRAR
jgi:predicted GNAT family acetyltransferase